MGQQRLTTDERVDRTTDTDNPAAPAEPGWQQQQLLAPTERPGPAARTSDRFRQTGLKGVAQARAALAEAARRTQASTGTKAA